jgi:hypothetical protein
MTVPETVALVAMGSSRMDYEAEVMRTGGKSGVADETWVVNKLGAVLHHDILFRMDDLQEEHACNMKRGCNKDDKTIHDTFDEFLINHNKPIITSTAYDEYPMSVTYPLEDVINSIGYSYFLSTPAYAAAYAIHLGVKHLKVYGCDYVYKNNLYLAESGRANLEFILAVGMMKGVTVEIAPTSTLIAQNRDIFGYFYAYKKVIEVVESEEEDKQFEVRERPDLTEQHIKKQKLEEQKQLQSLLSKYGEQVKRDLIQNNEITHADIDKYKENYNEAKDNNSNTTG